MKKALAFALVFSLHSICFGAGESPEPQDPSFLSNQPLGAGDCRKSIDDTKKRAALVVSLCNDNAGGVSVECLKEMDKIDQISPAQLITNICFSGRWAAPVLDVSACLERAEKLYPDAKNVASLAACERPKSGTGPAYTKCNSPTQVTRKVADWVLTKSLMRMGGRYAQEVEYEPNHAYTSTSTSTSTSVRSQTGQGTQ